MLSAFPFLLLEQICNVLQNSLKMKSSPAFCLLFAVYFSYSVFTAQSLPLSRLRRGASVYPVFGTGGHAVQVQHGPPPFAQSIGATGQSHYGGSSGGSSSYGAGSGNSYHQPITMMAASHSSNSYSAPAQSHGNSGYSSAPPAPSHYGSGSSSGGGSGYSAPAQSHNGGGGWSAPAPAPSPHGNSNSGYSAPATSSHGSSSSSYSPAPSASHGSSSYASPASSHGGASVTTNYHAPVPSYGGQSGGGSSYNPQHSGGALDMSLLNAYAQSSHASASTPASTSHSGWSPISGYGTHLSGGSSSYSNNGFYSQYHGHITPNFAHTTLPVTPPQNHYVPQLDANVLAQAAQTSFYAQNAYLDALLAGVHRPTYKGSEY